MFIFANDFIPDLDPDVNRNSPVFGQDSIVTSGNIATTTTNTGYPASNMANPATHLFWRGTTFASPEVITITQTGTIDYVGIAKHNLATAGASLKIDIATDGVPTYSTVYGPALQTDNTPIMVCFAERNATHVRITLGAGTAIPQIAVLQVGKALFSPRRVYVGVTPITLGRQSRVTNGRSEAGNFLGRIVVGQGLTSSIALKNLHPLWYRNKLDPLIIRSKEYPFFFAWRPYTYPNEIAYAWTSNDPRPVNAMANGFMQIDLELSAIA
jgi:hypothetical protein